MSAELLVEEALKLPLLPLTVDKLMNLGAALRGSHYLSAPSYLRTAKAEHVAADLPWSGSLERCFNRCVKACRRGRGLVTRAGLGDMEAFSMAPWVEQSVAARGPVAASTYALVCVLLAANRHLQASISDAFGCHFCDTLDKS